MGAEKADCPLQRALETAWNPKLVHDHANPLGSSRYEPVVYHLISMLNPADPQNLENFDPTRFSRHRPQVPPLNSAGFGVRDRPESQLSRALPLLVAESMFGEC